VGSLTSIATTDFQTGDVDNEEDDDRDQCQESDVEAEAFWEHCRVNC
jgi:hypothetical protein